MALFMHIHHLARGVSIADLAVAHRNDLEVQEKYGVSYLRYWIDLRSGRMFCLVEADAPDHACAVHREAHGLVADEVYAVSEHT